MCNQGRFAGPEPAYELVAASGLPSEIRKRVRTVLDEMGADPAQRADVARELIAHFEDGLSAGRSVGELLHDFGDERTAARLIAEQRRSPARLDLVSGDGDPLLNTLWRNTSHAARHLMKSPGFTVTAILSLALGIGANIAIFSLVNAMLLSGPKLAQPEELVQVHTSYAGRSYGMFAYPDFEDLRDGTRDAFAGLAAGAVTIGQVDRDGSVETVLGEVVSGSNFDLLGIGARSAGPSPGRTTFTPVPIRW